MAKKKHKKKHAFKHQSAVSSAPATASVATSSAAAAAAPSEWSIVARDVQRVLVLAAAFIVLEVVLSYVMNHTGFGSHVYNSIKL